MTKDVVQAILEALPQDRSREGTARSRTCVDRSSEELVSELAGLVASTAD